MGFGKKERNIWYYLGLKEEDVAECGGSVYFHSGGLCFVRGLIGIANLATFVWFLTTPTVPVELRFLWLLPDVPRWSSVEAWTLLAVSVASFMLAFVSSQYARGTARTDLWARIAGPITFAATTISVYSLAVTPFSYPPTPARYLLHIPPLSLLVLELVLAARLRFRIRAIGFPLGLVQTQQSASFLYLQLAKKESSAKVSTLQFLGLGIAAFAVTVACAVFVWLVSCITQCFEKEEEVRQRGSIDYPVSPSKVAVV